MSDPGSTGRIDQLIEKARSAKMISPAIEELAVDLIAFGSARAVIEQAVETSDPDTAARLMLAAATAGEPPSSEQIARVIPFIDSVEHMPILVGCATGDRVQMLLDLIDRGQMSSEREAMAVFLATELLEGTPPPAELLTHLRLLSRIWSSDEASMLLGLAAEGLDDADTREVAADCIAMAGVLDAEVMAEQLRRALAGPPTSVLPARESRKVVSGFTVRRPAAKVGRNDPCPCGSGKKYKRCCMKKDAERLSDPSPVAGLTMSEYVAQAGQHMDIDEFYTLRPTELQRLDLGSLPTTHLIAALRRFATFRFWDDAERAIDILEDREDLPLDLDDYREELIVDAVQAGEFAVARRQSDRLEAPERLVTTARLELELAEARAPVLSRIEDEAREGLEEDAEDPFALAYALIDHYPALGILAARAQLDPARPLDSEVLLGAIERARDRLQLPPGDPAAYRYEQLADQHYDQMLTEAASKELTEQNEQLVEEVEDLRERLRDSTVRSRSLESSLQEAASQLALVEPAVDAHAEPGEAERGSGLEPGTQPSEESLELRRKVSDLKSLINQKNRERAAMRKDLAHLKERLSADEKRADEATAGAKGEPLADLEGPEVATQPRTKATVLLPVFTKRAQTALGEAEQRLGRATVLLAGKLAAGDEAAWRGVKRLRTTSGVFSVRPGKRHRMLFEVDESAGELLVRDLIDRKELETVIKRYR